MIISSRRAQAALSVTATAAAAVLLLSACSGGTTDSGEAAVEGPSFVYITSDPIGQNAFLQSGKIGIDAVAAEFEGTAKTYESKDDATRRSNL
jgi:basic membrane protein A